jgi:hypothetical protein
MMTSDFMILPLMEVSMKSGEGQVKDRPYTEVTQPSILN